MGLLDKYDDEFIERYLMHELTDADKLALETDMQIDKELLEYVATQQQLMLAALSYSESKLIENIKNLEKTLNEEGFFITDDEIDNYLSGLAEMSENRKMELLCIENDDFKKRIEQHRLLIESIKSESSKALEYNLKQVETQLEKEGFFEAHPQKNKGKKAGNNNRKEKSNNQNSFQIFKWTAVAATLLLLVLAGRFWLLSGSTTPIYTTYFNALEDKLSPKIVAELSETGFGGSPATSLKDLKKGMEYYQAKKYKESIPILREYIKQNPMAANIQEAQLYLAISYMSCNHSKEALPFLLALSASQPQGEIASNLQWYLALCYLQNNQEAEGKAILEVLKSDEKYKNMAIELLEKLN